MRIDTYHNLEEILRFKPKIFPPKKKLKKSKLEKTELRKEEVASLLEQTNYTEEEIHSWFIRFQKECPKGVLSRKKVDHRSLKLLVPLMIALFIRWQQYLKNLANPNPPIWPTIYWVYLTGKRLRGRRRKRSCCHFELNISRRDHRGYLGFEQFLTATQQSVGHPFSIWS